MSEEDKASQEDVHFDNGRADQLMRQLREASEYLHTTDSTQRSGDDRICRTIRGPFCTQHGNCSSRRKTAGRCALRRLQRTSEI